MLYDISDTLIYYGVAAVKSGGGGESGAGGKGGIGVTATLLLFVLTLVTTNLG